MKHKVKRKPTSDQALVGRAWDALNAYEHALQDLVNAGLEVELTAPTRIAATEKYPHGRVFIPVLRVKRVLS